MIALVLLLGANIPGALAQTDTASMVSVATTFIAEANAHNLGCGGLGDHSRVDKAQHPRFSSNNRQ
jgi:hypothetical protein